MLIRGALTGIALAAPSIKAAFASLRRIDIKSGSAEELPLKYLYLGVGVSIVGTLWMGLAGIIVAQATGMTDWSPISGLTLISVVLVLVMTGNSVPAALLVGAAVCVAIAECADMMQGLKTGHLVGATPIRQQIVEFSFVWIGPIVCLAVIAILWNSFGFGPGHNLTAPQAQAVQAAVEGVLGGEIPWAKYFGGAVIGGTLGLTGITGLGVLVGLSMYLPLAFILPYGLGCLVQIIVAKTKETKWTEERGLPVAAGLLVGEPLVVLVQSLLIIGGIILPPG